MPTLLYIGQNPGVGTGSPIIILRHLRRFAAEGWNIVVVADYGGDYRACVAAGWTVVPLCHRRWWWPPLRDGSAGLRWLRLRLLARDAAAMSPPPDVILSYLASHTDFSADLAGHVARITGAPLHVLVHDDAAAFPGGQARVAELRQEHERILRPATACWFVSPELADCYPTLGTRRRLLPPLPEGWAEPATWNEARAREPRVYYAGYVWPQQLPLFARIGRVAREAGTELVVLSRPSPALDALAAAEGIRRVDPFPTNREALAHLVADAAGVVVSYAESVDAMPWCATSFPSKLVEYCHLGLPIAIIAPSESAVAHWARKAGFPSFFEPDQVSGLQRWLADLRRREVWQARAGVSLQLARTEFDPERIQRALANALLPGTERRAA